MIAPVPITRVGDYDGGDAAIVAATQLESPLVTRSSARRIFDEWQEFFRAPTPIRHLRLASRVPQELLDALAGQSQLETLSVKWGPYRDLSPLSGLAALHDLRLGGATKVVDLSPLVALRSLTALDLDQVVSVADPSVLGRMTTLTSLAFGNANPGSDRLVKIGDLEWVSPLRHLKTVRLVQVKLASRDLTPLLALPLLERVELSMRREFRDQVRDLAARSPAFAELDRDFAAREGFAALSDLRPGSGPGGRGTMDPWV